MMSVFQQLTVGVCKNEGFRSCGFPAEGGLAGAVALLRQLLATPSPQSVLHFPGARSSVQIQSEGNSFLTNQTKEIK